jgi:hypothetical protein
MKDVEETEESTFLVTCFGGNMKLTAQERIQIWKGQIAFYLHGTC